MLRFHERYLFKRNEIFMNFGFIIKLKFIVSEFNEFVSMLSEPLNRESK